MTDENVQLQIARAQETANQAFDLAKNNSVEIGTVKERVGDLAQRLAFQEKVILNHADSIKTCSESVTAIQISNAGISNEMKNMGLTANRIEASVAEFKLSVQKGFGDFKSEVETIDTKIEGLTTDKATMAGSWKTWCIIGAVFVVLMQIVVPIIMAHYIAPAPSSPQSDLKHPCC